MREAAPRFLWLLMCQERAYLCLHSGLTHVMLAHAPAGRVTGRDRDVSGQCLAVLMSPMKRPNEEPDWYLQSAESRQHCRYSAPAMAKRPPSI